MLKQRYHQHLRMGKGGHVTTEVLAKICAAMDCTLDDIMEIIPDECAK